MEERLERVELDVTEIRTQLGTVATKSDVAGLQAALEQRDDRYTSNLWRLVFGLTGLVAILAGVTQLAKVFLPGA